MMTNKRIEDRACIANTLAEEAAAILRAMDALADEDDLGDLRVEARRVDLVEAIESMTDGPSLNEVRVSLRLRLQSITETAKHISASSLKGAIFQLLLSTREAALITSNFVENRLHISEFDYLRETETTISHLNISAIAVLEGIYFDSDLKRIREHYWRPEGDPRKCADQVIATVRAAA